MSNPKVGWGFLCAYTAAQIGAFVSFTALLQIIIPLKAAAIDPAHKGALLSDAMIWGAVTASLANLCAGALSDRTRSPIGRRRPWMLAGLVGVLASYAFIAQANNAILLVAGLICFQITFNLFFGAFGAVMADRIPDLQKGFASALMSLGYPVGTAISLALVGALAHDMNSRLWILGLSVTACIMPFLFVFKEKMPRVGVVRAAISFSPTMTSDFALAMASRFGVLMGQVIIQNYMLYNLHDWGQTHVMGVKTMTPEAALASLVGISTITHVLASLAGGKLSDLFGRRRLFVLTGAAGLAAALAAIALAPSWPVLVGAYLLLGAAIGCYHAAEGALMVQVLPSTDNAGRDLGWVNISNTLPQVSAAVLALLVVRHTHASYAWLFLIGAGLSIVGGFTSLFIRSVR